MPLVRIDLSRSLSKDCVRAISSAVYDAMVEVANVPLHDKFQVITRHEDDEIIYPTAGYLGQTYTPDIIVIEVVWVAGRSVDVKKQFYQSIVRKICETQDVKPADIIVTLVGNEREDWSFGGGIMQYAPKE